MLRNHFLAGVSAFFCALLSATPQPVVATPSTQSAVDVVSTPAITQITAQIDNSVRRTLVGNTDRTLVAGVDHGAIEADFPMQHMWLQLRRSPEREQAFVQLIDQLHDPHSPNFHRWLTAEQVGSLFGPAQQDIDTVAAWLSDQGFTVEGVTPSGMIIEFSGTAAQVDAAFATEMHRYQVGAHTYISNNADPSLPAALLPAVVGVTSLNDHFAKPQMRARVEPRPQPWPAEPSIAQFVGVRPALTTIIGGSTYYALAPADFNTIYNVGPVWARGVSGAGQTIAVAEASNIKAADVTSFRNAFGLSGFTGTFSQIHPAGSTTCTNPGTNSFETEAALDAEWAGVAAPSAAIQLASCRDTTTVFGIQIAIQNLVSSVNPPPIISLSYSLCEASNTAAANAAWVTTWQQAAAEGITGFVSSDDGGAAGCDDPTTTTVASGGIAVNSFASTPYNVAVGGTDFLDTYNALNGGPPVSTYWNATNGAAFASARSYIPEQPWDDSCANVFIYLTLNFTQAWGSTGACNSAAAQNGGFVNFGAAGGGPSNVSAKPSWQVAPGVPADGKRGLPDVSLFAADGVWNHFLVYCMSDLAQSGAACNYPANVGSLGAGGTSFSAPSLAGIQALINQSTGQHWGNMNTQYYPIAAAEYGDPTYLSDCNSSNGPPAASRCVFYDVTKGDIDVVCTVGSPNCFGTGTNGVLSTNTSGPTPTIAYGTNAGWDFATGLGTVNVDNLVTAMTPSLPFKLAITQQPNASYVANNTITVKVSVENFAGNVITADTSAVTLSLSGGTAGATLGGTVTQNAVAGVATFNVSVNTAGSGYTLVATDGTFRAATSSAFAITPAIPAAISFSTQPSNAAAGASIAPAIVVHVQDAGGSPIVGDGVTLSIANNVGAAALTGGASVNTNASGDAAFAGVSLDKKGTGYTLTATESSAPPLTATSNAFDINAAAPAQLKFTTQPPASFAYGTAFGAAVTVYDSFGNVVDTDASAVSIALTAAGGATLTGSGTVNAVNGVATFSGIGVDTAGSYTLTASDAALTPDTSGSFTITPAAQTISFTSTPPTQAVVNGPTYTVAATATSGLAVSFSIDASAASVCSIANGVVSFTAVGTCKIDADQAGNGNYNAAPQAQQSFSVGVGAAAQIVFTMQPADIAAGGALSTIAVTEMDAFDNVVDDAGTVDFSVAACSGSVHLGSATFVNGVATLSTPRRFYVPAGSVTIAASTGTLQASSAAFAVHANPDILFSGDFEVCQL